MSWREELEKDLTFVIRYIVSKIFGKKNTVTKTPVILKTLKLSLDGRTGTNFIASLRMYFQRSKSTLGSLKGRVFNVFKRKPSLPRNCSHVQRNLQQLGNDDWPGLARLNSNEHQRGEQTLRRFLFGSVPANFSHGVELIFQ